MRSPPGEPYNAAMPEREPSVLGDPEAAGGGPAEAPSSSESRGKSADPGPPAEPAAARPMRRPTGPTFHAAGFWRRLGGAGIDLAILIPVALIMCWLAGLITGIHLPATRYRALDTWLDLFLSSDPALVGGLGLTIAIGCIYAAVFQVTMARTPGMMVTKTRIIDLYGDPPSTARAAARTAGYVAGVATLGLGFLWIGFDAEKRGLHDWISGTHVVKA